MNTDEDEDNNVTSAYCIGIMICEYLIMFQGFAYVTVYLLIDDVFRPYFLQPFLKLQCRVSKKISFSTKVIDMSVR